MTVISKNRIFPLVVTLFVYLQSASADTTCRGEIEFVGLDNGGVVLLKGPGGLPYVYVCNLNEQANNVKPETCRGIYSTLLSAEAQNKSVDITFLPTIGSCEDVTEWAYAANLHWVILR